MRFILKHLWVDSDEMPQIEVFLEGDGYSATQDIYIYPSDLEEFGKKLEQFPSSVTEEVVLEIGSTEGNHYCWFKLRAYIYDGVGHCAFEISTKKNGAVHLKAQSQFSVLTEAASLNFLGKEIKNWAKYNETPLIFAS